MPAFHEQDFGVWIARKGARPGTPGVPLGPPAQAPAWGRRARVGPAYTGYHTRSLSGVASERSTGEYGIMHGFSGFRAIGSFVRPFSFYIPTGGAGLSGCPGCGLGDWTTDVFGNLSIQTIFLLAGASFLGYLLLFGSRAKERKSQLSKARATYTADVARIRKAYPRL